MHFFSRRVFVAFLVLGSSGVNAGKTAIDQLMEYSISGNVSGVAGILDSGVVPVDCYWPRIEIDPDISFKNPAVIAQNLDFNYRLGVLRGLFSALSPDYLSKQSLCGGLDEYYQYALPLYLRMIFDVSRYISNRELEIWNATFEMFTPLVCACIAGQEEVVKLLLSRGANPWGPCLPQEYCVQDPLHLQFAAGMMVAEHAAIIQLLCEAQSVNESPSKLRYEVDGAYSKHGFDALPQSNYLFDADNLLGYVGAHPKMVYASLEAMSCLGLERLELALTAAILMAQVSNVRFLLDLGVDPNNAVANLLSLPKLNWSFCWCSRDLPLTSAMCKTVALLIIHGLKDDLIAVCEFEETFSSAFVEECKLLPRQRTAARFFLSPMPSIDDVVAIAQHFVAKLMR